MRDLYTEAADMGRKQAKQLGPLKQHGPAKKGGHWMSEEERTLYWTARHAARQAADALLEAARGLNLTEEQVETLRQVAAEVAYD